MPAIEIAGLCLPLKPQKERGYTGCSNNKKLGNMRQISAIVGFTRKTIQVQGLLYNRVTDKTLPGDFWMDINRALRRSGANPQGDSKKNL